MQVWILEALCQALCMRIIQIVLHLGRAYHSRIKMSFVWKAHRLICSKLVQKQHHESIRE